MRISESEAENSRRLLSRPLLDSQDKASLDPRLERLVLEQLREVPEVRAEMVRPLREAVESNRYRVCCERVASMMVGRDLADSVR